MKLNGKRQDKDVEPGNDGTSTASAPKACVAVMSKQI